MIVSFLLHTVGKTIPCVNIPQKTMKTRNATADRGGFRAESCVWTDEEVGLLLQMTLNYKMHKLKEKRDWETCASKYADIWVSFLDELRQKETCADFPRTNDEITKSQLTAKLKSIRGKYRKAMESGRRSGHGRVVLLFYEVCDRIWGGSLTDVFAPRLPQTPALEAGVESADLKDEATDLEKAEAPENTSPSTSRSPSPCSERAPASPSTFTRTKQTTATPQMQPQVNGHSRSSPLKRRAASDFVQEDLEIKRGMLELLRSQSQRADERMDKLMTSMDALINVIAQSHAQLLAQSQCTCRGRPPQAAESHCAPGQSGHGAVARTPQLVDSFTLAVKKEPEDPAAQDGT